MKLFSLVAAALVAAMPLAAADRYELDPVHSEANFKVRHLMSNVTGAFNCIRAAAPTFRGQKFGKVVNISAHQASRPGFGVANYAASKGGLIALTKSVAKELGSRNILVNAVAPGFIETEMTDAMTPEARAALNGIIPLERLGKVDDIASMVVFLASDHASYITGQVLVVDGGMVM